MGFLTWLKDPGLRGRLLWQIISTDDKDRVADALERLRDQGWLEDGSMRGIDLREAQLTAADLHDADLEDGRFDYADMPGADLSGASLRWATFDFADLTGANFQDADLRGASFRKAKVEGANFQGADLGRAYLRHVLLADADVRGARLDETDLEHSGLKQAQLLKVETLAEAIMADGTTYDGRFNLPADLLEASESGANIDDAEDMALYYGVSQRTYEMGQEWAAKNKRPRKLPAVKKEAQKIVPPVDDEAEDDDTASDQVSISFVDMLEMPFSEPEALNDILADDEFAEKFQGMAARVSAVLLWLPAFIMTLEVLFANFVRPRSVLDPGVDLADFLSFGTLLLVIAGVVLTAAALKTNGSGGVVLGITASLLALPVKALAAEIPIIAAACLISLILAYAYLGRSARITVFWVSAALISRPIGMLIMFLVGRTGLDDPLLIAAVGWTLGWVLQYPLGIMAIMLLRHIARSGLVGLMSSGSANAMRALQAVYALAIFPVIWAIIVDFPVAIARAVSG